MADQTHDVEKKIDLVIPMVPKMEMTAVGTAVAVAEFMELDTGKIEEMKIALIEACINAIEHSKSEERRVYISFDVGEDALTIQIGDKGQGFSPEEAQKKVDHRRAQGEQRRGWGLTLMEEMMDEVQIQSGENGTVLRMVKRR
ncbi:MAG: ATP-binding protein [bacterium]|nr:ATP-binding protein [bacterium]